MIIAAATVVVGIVVMVAILNRTQFETIRVMIRQLYLYGCYNRSDYKSIVSGRKFDNELKRAKMVLNTNNIVQSFKGKTKYTSIVHDYFSENQNVLADTYLAKAFNKNEFILYFYRFFR